MQKSFAEFNKTKRSKLICNANAYWLFQRALDIEKIDNGDNNVFIEEWDTTYVWLYIFINNHETKN